MFVCSFVPVPFCIFDYLYWDFWSFVDCLITTAQNTCQLVLMFGRVPRLLIDLILPTCHSTTPSQPNSSCVEAWKEQMKEAYQLVFYHSNETKTKDIIRWNTKRPGLTALGLVRDRWNRQDEKLLRRDIYNIVSSIGNDPVIDKISSERNPDGKTITFHRNKLMNCNNLLEYFDWNIREPASQKHSF